MSMTWRGRGRERVEGEGERGREGGEGGGMNIFAYKGEGGGRACKRISQYEQTKHDCSSLTYIKYKNRLQSYTYIVCAGCP